MPARVGAVGVGFEDLTVEFVPDLPDGAAGGERQHRGFHGGHRGIVEYPCAFGDEAGLLLVQHTAVKRADGVGQPVGHLDRDANAARGGHRGQGQLRGHFVGGVVGAACRIVAQRGEPGQHANFAGVQPSARGGDRPQLGEQLCRRHRLHSQSTRFAHAFDTTGSMARFPLRSRRSPDRAVSG